MKKILILNDNIPFRQGLKRLFELKFGDMFEIIESEFERIHRKVLTNVHMIIVESVPNSIAENYLLKMRDLGAKVILLTVDPRIVQDNSQYETFDGFLLKSMPTNQLLHVIENTLFHDETYVHPDFGFIFFQKYKGLRKQMA